MIERVRQFYRFYISKLNVLKQYAQANLSKKQNKILICIFFLNHSEANLHSLTVNVNLKQTYLTASETTENHHLSLGF